MLIHVGVFSWMGFAHWTDRMIVTATFQRETYIEEWHQYIYIWFPPIETYLFQGHDHFFIPFSHYFPMISISLGRILCYRSCCFSRSAWPPSSLSGLGPTRRRRSYPTCCGVAWNVCGRRYESLGFLVLGGSDTMPGHQKGDKKRNQLAKKPFKHTKTLCHQLPLLEC